MKTLYLMRHAKSDWSGMLVSDQDRILNERGRDAADLIGQKLAAAGFAPDAVLCSTAQRTRETLSRVMEAGGFDWQPQFEQSLYGASASTLLATVRAAPPSASCILLVCHNPGIQDLALILSEDSGGDRRRLIQRKVPAGAFIGLEFEGDSFDGVIPGTGAITHFLRPKHEFLQ